MPAKSKAQRRMMAITDAAYIAGFLDGEGYVTIRRTNRRTAKNPCYRLVVGFTNKSLNVLTYIQGFTAGCINPKVHKNPNAAPAFELTIHNRVAVGDLLQAVRPFVKIKMAQVELGAQFLALGYVRKTMTTVRWKAWPLFDAIPSDIQLRESMKVALNKLNQRGVDAGC